MPYYFSWFITLIFTDQFVCVYNQAAVEIVSLRMKISTCSKSGENHYLTELPAITYIYLYRRIYATCLS